MHCLQVGQLHTVYPEAIHESLLSAQGSLPLQTATYFSTVDVMEYVLDLYPEACLLKAPSENHENLLHVAVDISSSSYACTGSSEGRGSGSGVHEEEGLLHSTTDEDYYRACVAGKVIFIPSLSNTSSLHSYIHSSLSSLLHSCIFYALSSFIHPLFIHTSSQYSLLIQQPINITTYQFTFLTHILIPPYQPPFPSYQTVA